MYKELLFLPYIAKVDVENAKNISNCDNVSIVEKLSFSGAVKNKRL